MKSLTLITFSLLLISSAVSFAQENFKPGFIVTINNDTVQGLIDYRNWDMNPSEIAFRESISNEVRTLNPSNISAFTVAGEAYVSGVVKVETSPYLVNELKEDAELHLETESTFLYCLVQGAKSLLHYKDARNKDHFYIPTDSGMTLLIHKTYLKKVDKKDIQGRPYTGNVIETKYYFKTENKFFLGQLASYLQDCQAILPIISSVKYTQSGLVNLFKLYQRRCDPNVIVNSTRSAFTTYGIISGASLNSLEWNENQTFDFSQTQYGYNPNMVIGAFLELKFRGHLNKWSVNNELLYAPFRVKGIYENVINEGRYVRIKTDIGSGYIKLNTMLRFRYTINNWSLFVNGGLSNSYGKVNHNRVDKYTFNYGDENSEFNIAMKSTDKYELGFNFGLGAGYKKWSFEVRRELGDGMSGLVALNSKTKRYYLLLSYRF